MKKLVFVGNCGVGKTTIIRRYILNLPTLDTHSTLSAAYYEVTKYSSDRKIAIWDTAGQERFKSIAPIYYQNSQGCICVFDVTVRTSFDACEDWIKLFLDKCKCVNPFILLVGNKCDLSANNKIVGDSEISVLCNMYGCEYVETDCVNMINELAFFDLMSKFVSQTHEAPILQNTKLEWSGGSKCTGSGCF